MIEKNVKGVTRYTCDGCGAVTYQENDAPDPVLGWHGGSVACHGTFGGGGSPSWFACSDGCIRDAIVNAVFGKEQG